jgi:uncharacterized protein with HEPN domain
MLSEDNDMARLWDMLDAAQAAIRFTSGANYKDFLDNRMLRNAVERNLEIIGEAARCVSQGIRDAHPEIPWTAIIALRNVLTHEYGEIRYERLWTICAEQLSVLVAQLKGIGDIDPFPEAPDSQ